MNGLHYIYFTYKVNKLCYKKKKIKKKNHEIICDVILSIETTCAAHFALKNCMNTDFSLKIQVYERKIQILIRYNN